MILEIHPPTMFLALVGSTIAAMLVLLWCYWLNRGEKGLLWTAVAFLLSAVATFIMARRGEVPDWLSIGFGGGLLMLAASMMVMAARAFAAKPVLLWVPIPGLVIWAVATATPAVFDSRDLRLVVLTLLCGAYYLAAARAFYVRDGLLTRLPIVIVLAVHAIFVLARIPMIFGDGVDGILLTSAGWFGFSMLEAVIFIQVSAFLMVSLTKERVEKRLRDAALTDQLTGLGNRRAFFERGNAAVALATRSGSPLSVVLFDLDRFKQINDRFGHPVGDAVIQMFARTAVSRLRGGDVVTRLGGEEFAVFLPNTTGDHATLVALQVAQAFEAAVGSMGYDGLNGTSCAGVANLCGALPTLESLLSAADAALYEAKGLGRGQVRLITVNDLDARAA